MSRNLGQDLFLAPLKGMLSVVALSVEVEQLKLKIPGVCDAHRLVRRRPGGECGETEESLSVLLSQSLYPTRSR